MHTVTHPLRLAVCEHPGRGRDVPSQCPDSKFLGQGILSQLQFPSGKKTHHISTQPLPSSSCRFQPKSRKAGTRSQVTSFRLTKLGAKPLLDVITVVLRACTCGRQSMYPDLAWKAKQKDPLGEALLPFPEPDISHFLCLSSFPDIQPYACLNSFTIVYGKTSGSPHSSLHADIVRRRSFLRLSPV